MGWLARKMRGPRWWGLGVPRRRKAAQHSAGFGPDVTRTFQVVPDARSTPGIRGMATQKTNRGRDADQDGWREEAWFARDIFFRAFKEVAYFNFSGSPSGPG